MSELDKLAQALSKAQNEFKSVQKTGRNPHLRNEYATLDDIINAVRPSLCKYGLSFVQLLGSDGAGVTTLKTLLMHESGQWLEANVAVDSSEQRGVNALQSLGAAITYMKRYSLSAMLGIAADVDTDGEGTEKAVQKRAQTPAPEAPKPEPKPESAPANGTANGNGHIGAEPPARRPADLLAVVNGRLTIPYDNIHHLQQGIRKELGPDWGWPQFKDSASWLAAYAAAIKHGKAKENASELDAAFPREEA